MNDHFDKATIKKLRKALRVTQVDFARILDVDPITISRWERGETKPLPVHKRKLMRLQKKALTHHQIS